MILTNGYMERARNSRRKTQNILGQPQGLPLQKITFCFLDVETTGLHPQYGDRICEIGLLKTKNNKVIDSYEALINPCRPISPGASMVNGITDKMVKDAPVFGEVVNRILEFIGGTVIIAHTAGFDLNFIGSHLRNLKKPLPNNPIIDTLTLARKYYCFPSNSLTNVASYFDINISNCHRALADAKLTKEIFHTFLTDFKSRGLINQFPTLSHLLELQGSLFILPAYDEIILPPEIEEAIKNNKRLKIIYVSAFGAKTSRTIEPIDIISSRDYTYLVAHCQLRDEKRTFRLDRIIEMEEII